MGGIKTYPLIIAPARRCTSTEVCAATLLELAGSIDNRLSLTLSCPVAPLHRSIVSWLRNSPPWIHV